MLSTTATGIRLTPIELFGPVIADYMHQHGLEYESDNLYEISGTLYNPLSPVNIKVKYDCRQRTTDDNPIDDVPKIYMTETLLLKPKITLSDEIPTDILRDDLSNIGLMRREITGFFEQFGIFEDNMFRPNLKKIAKKYDGTVLYILE